MPWSHGSNITNLKHYILSFLDVKMTASLRMCFCQINTAKIVQSHPIKMGRLWTKRDFVARKIFPARTVTICDMHKSNSGFCTSLDMLGEINFQLKLFLKTSFFLFENCCLGKKIRVKVMGTFRWLVGSRNLQLMTDLKQKHLVTSLL